MRINVLSVPLTEKEKYEEGEEVVKANDEDDAQEQDSSRNGHGYEFRL